MRKILCSIALIVTLSSNVVLAQAMNHTATIGNDALNIATPTKSSENIANTPKITQYVVSGNVDNTKTGIDFYKNIAVTLIGDNLTDSNFLTKEGLHWSNKTYVELIKGQELGILNDAKTFGKQNTPTTNIKAYSNNKGDSGRINFVGKTKSNVELDLIWTVIDSNQDDWAKNSGYHNNSRVKGLGFAGEQFIPGATGNSIVVLYNNASHLAINYKIVKHGTFEEMPVVLSFISTDIDAAQGVQTNLANITEIIPKQANLVKKDEVIYDTTTGVVGLNGSVDLPKGGYLGVGFLSRFDYVFYSPAPERKHNAYRYPIAVRYDIFGSSLQANLYTRLKNHITVNYIDELGKHIKPSEQFEGFHDEKYLFESVEIPKYQLVDIRKNETNLNYPKIDFVYRPVYHVTLKFLDEHNQPLLSDKTFSVEKGAFIYEAPSIDNYVTPKAFNMEVDSDIEYVFRYEKVVKLVDKKDTTSQKTTETRQETVRLKSQGSIKRINNINNNKTNIQKVQFKLLTK